MRRPNCPERCGVRITQGGQLTKRCPNHRSRSLRGHRHRKRRSGHARLSAALGSRPRHSAQAVQSPSVCAGKAGARQFHARVRHRYAGRNDGSPGVCRSAVCTSRLTRLSHGRCCAKSVQCPADRVGGWPRLLILLARPTQVGAPSFAQFAKGGNHDPIRNGKRPRPSISLLTLPVPELWVPRPCVLGTSGYVAACTMSCLCPAACIGPTALITCTLSLPPATAVCLFLVRLGAATASSRFWNRLASATASSSSDMS